MVSANGDAEKRTTRSRWARDSALRSRFDQQLMQIGLTVSLLTVLAVSTFATLASTLISGQRPTVRRDKLPLTHGS